ncbi:MAG TPA: NAD(P)H-hydrate dehydratase [Acetobacteraceae bacterium]
MTPVTSDLLRANPLPSHEETQDKDGRGRVLVVGGSLEVPGGALLAAVGALRAGAGKLQVATCRTIAPHLGLALPEALVLGLPETEAGGIGAESAERVIARADRVDALLVGPGMMDPDATQALVAAILASTTCTAIVLDAGALHGLERQAGALRRHAGRVVLTPHAGEMAHLLGVEREAVEAEPLAHARRAAAMLHSVVVMKGGETTVVTPQGEAWHFTGGTVGLATSGSGDTLAGVVAGLLARGAVPLWAAVWGVYLHGTAGCVLMQRHGGVGFLARELLAEIPALMAELEAEIGAKAAPRSAA